MTVSYPVLEPVAKYGFLGVYLFFMISGFVIVRSVGHGRLDRFLRSRIWKHAWLAPGRAHMLTI